MTAAHCVSGIPTTQLTARSTRVHSFPLNEIGGQVNLIQKGVENLEEVEVPDPEEQTKPRDMNQMPPGSEYTFTRFW